MIFSSVEIRVVLSEDDDQYTIWRQAHAKSRAQILLSAWKLVTRYCVY